MEAAIEHPASAAETKDTKPVVLPQDALLPEISSVPRLNSPSGSTSSAMEMQSVHSHDGTANGEEAAYCRVCLKDGAVVMCDGCKKCYHLDCHLPTLLEIPGYTLSHSSLLLLTPYAFGEEGGIICLRIAMQAIGQSYEDFKAVIPTYCPFKAGTCPLKVLGIFKGACHFWDLCGATDDERGGKNPG